MSITRSEFFNLCEVRNINPSVAIENDQVKEAFRLGDYNELINALDQL
jgi:hypothetical protein